MSDDTTPRHARGGSWTTWGGGSQRQCTCGAAFFGTPTSTFTAREDHIFAENANEDEHSDR